MISNLTRIWNNIFAPRRWGPYPDPVTREWKMRRWHEQAWQYRELTDEEYSEANEGWAIK